MDNEHLVDVQDMSGLEHDDEELREGQESSPGNAAQEIYEEGDDDGIEEEDEDDGQINESELVDGDEGAHIVEEGAEVEIEAGEHLANEGGEDGKINTAQSFGEMPKTHDNGD